jgi:hypothetical protein
LQSLEDSVTDSSTSNGSDNLAFEIECVSGYLSNIPVVGNDLLVGRDLVPDQGQDGHDNVLGNRDDVGAGDFRNGDLVLVGFVEINVVATNTSRDTKLELGSFVDEVGGKVTWVEGGGDEDFRLQ